MPLPQLDIPVILKKSSKDIVYTYMKQWIIDGVLTPNEKIYDSEIAAYFNVSRTPVREAILSLENQNLVEVIPGKGTLVANFNMDNIKVLYEAITSIQTSVLTLAFPKIQNEHLEELKKINKSFLTYEKFNDIDNMRSTDYAFHQVFFDLANNTYLNSFNEQLLTHITRIENIFFRTKKNVTKSYNAHKNIIHFLKIKDLENANKALVENWFGALGTEIDNL